jgi:hypothetical protein
MDPKSVTSPQRRWQMVRVIYDGGADGYSVALGFWDKEPVLATRWNGPIEGLGHPTSFAYPVWFIQPRDLWDGIIGSGIFLAEDIRLARVFLGLDSEVKAA